MRAERLAQWRQLEQSAEDTNDRADPEHQRQAEAWGSCRASADDFQSLEIWRRVLAAYTQPLPDAAD